MLQKIKPTMQLVVRKPFVNRFRYSFPIALSLFASKIIWCQRHKKFDNLGGGGGGGEKIP